MNETEVAKAIASAALPSPQRLGNSSLVALRISGTGLAERPSINETVYRDPKIWLAPETLSRCNGLSVIVDHPGGPSTSLTPEEFAARSAGSVLFPYVADRTGVQNVDGPDLWGIARLFLDEGQVAALGDLSTSPAVTFASADLNETITLDDGTECLVEASPQLIDHVAIVTEGGGVWDKNLKNSGFRQDGNGEKQVADSDDTGGGNIDKLLERINDSVANTVVKKFDAMASKLRRDAERDHFEREDGREQCGKDDAAERADAESMTASGEESEAAMDKARKNRRDRRDKRRADANPLGHYAVDPERQRALGKTDTEERRDSALMADMQVRADAIATAWGQKCPPPMQGERPIDYRVRILKPHQKHCTEPSFKELDLAAIAATHPAVLDGVESRIYADSTVASRTPESFDGLPVKVVRTDPETGHRITEWRGGPGTTTIFKQFAPPSQRVTAFNTPRFQFGEPV